MIAYGADFISLTQPVECLPCDVLARTDKDSWKCIERFQGEIRPSDERRAYSAPEFPPAETEVRLTGWSGSVGETFQTVFIGAEASGQGEARTFRGKTWEELEWSGTAEFVEHDLIEGSTGYVERVEEILGSAALGKARLVVATASDVVVRQSAREVLREISSALSDIDATGMPEMWAGEGADGSVVLEWILPGARIAFSLEREIADSSWSIVTDERFGLVSEYGLLNDSTIQDLLARFLQVIAQAP